MRVYLMEKQGVKDIRFLESLEAESGIEAGGCLETWGNRSKGVLESRVICGLEIPRGYDVDRETFREATIPGLGGCFFVLLSCGWLRVASYTSHHTYRIYRIICIIEGSSD